MKVADGREVIIFGYDGKEAAAFRIYVELQLGKEKWRAPVIFSDVVTRQGLLGQIGFFKFFNVDFRYAEKVMSIRRSK